MDIQLELEKKKIAVLGMGREGWSTYEFLRKIFPLKRLTLIDQNHGAFTDKILDENSELIFGDNYLDNLSAFDLIFKAPGIPSFLIPQDITPDKISSQTDLFLKLFSKQCVGVTGTKGKSTTSSLIYHIIKESGRNVHFAGNIGIPPLSLYNEIAENDVIVMELSSHQLENISISPHIGIILNLFEEHLDHYHSYREYCLAKLNLGKFQNDGDIPMKKQAAAAAMAFPRLCVPGRVRLLILAICVLLPVKSLIVTSFSSKCIPAPVVSIVENGRSPL